MPSKQVDEDVRETIRLLSSEDKRKVLEKIEGSNFNQVTEELDGRGYTFVRQSFLGFEELGLVSKDEETGELYRTSQGDQILDVREDFDEEYRSTVERFFEHEYSVEDADLVHDFVDFDDGEMNIDVPGIPEEFLRMEDMFDLFYQLEPDQRMDDLGERFDITEPSVRKRLQSLERHGLVNERKPNSHEKQYFYGPFAFPLLKMASEIEEVYNPGVDWSWIEEEEEDSVEMDFVDYSNHGSGGSWRSTPEQPQQPPEKQFSGEPEFFQAYDGVGEDYLMEKIDTVDGVDQLNQKISADNRAVHEVAAVNPNNVVLKGGYVWEGYNEQEIEEGDNLLVEYGQENSFGFDEVEALGKLGQEALE